MEYHLLKIERRNPRPVEYARLRNAAGWPEIDLEKIEDGLDKSLFSACITYKGKTVACGRVVGDGLIYFYLQDILVDPEFRDKGLGSMVMDVIMAYIKNNATKNSMIGLMAAEGKGAFYEKYGFKARPDNAPGMSFYWK